MVEGRPFNMLPRVSIISCTEPSGCAARKSHSSSIVVTDEAKLAGGGSQTPISVQQ